MSCSRVFMIAAFFGAISGLCACSADDASKDADAGALDATIDGTVSGCAPLSDFCGASQMCTSSLDASDDAQAWSGVGSCTFYQSTNACGAATADAGELMLDIAGSTTGSLFFYDSVSHALVGAAFYENQVQQKCWGIIPPTYCAEVSAGTACCNWSTAIAFQIFDAGVCAPPSGGGVSDAGSAADGG